MVHAGPKGQPMPLHYVLQGESLDNLADVIHQRRMLKMVRGARKAPDTKHIQTSQYFGQLQAHSGLLPTDVTRKRIQGKRAAAAYKK